MIHHDLPPTACPYCGYQIEACTPVNGIDTPVAGDVSICFGCAACSIFTQDLTLRTTTAAESMTLAFDPRVVEAQARISSRPR